MNKYLANLNKIEFVLTYACSGRCKHCSEGEHKSTGASIDKDRSIKAIRDITSKYDIHTCMTFGGEPLLCRDIVYEIHSVARECDIVHRQIITNGYFTQNMSEISVTAQKLFECGVNDVLLSVDAFHQEFIPLDMVEFFARELLRYNVPVRTQPAWLVSPDEDNSYNETTHNLLDYFEKMGINSNEGNIIFPSGNALKYLGEYFNLDSIPQDPYMEDPYNIKTVSFDPDGSVLGGNFYKNDILDIIESYTP